MQATKAIARVQLLQEVAYFARLDVWPFAALYALALPALFLAGVLPKPAAWACWGAVLVLHGLVMLLQHWFVDVRAFVRLRRARAPDQVRRPMAERRGRFLPPLSLRGSKAWKVYERHSSSIFFFPTPSPRPRR